MDVSIREYVSMVGTQFDGGDEADKTAALPDDVFEEALDSFTALQVERVQRMYNRHRALFAEHVVAALLPGATVSVNPSTAWDVVWTPAPDAVPLRLQVKCSGEYLPRMGRGYRSASLWSFPPSSNGFDEDGMPLGAGRHCDVFVLARHRAEEIARGWDFFVLPARSVVKDIRVRPVDVENMGAARCEPAALASTIRRMMTSGAHRRGRIRPMTGDLPTLTTLEPLLLIRLKAWEPVNDPITGRGGLGFREGMSDQELYDSTRCWWRLDPRSVQRRGIEHAVAVHKGVTRALFTIDRWSQRDDRRWRFDGAQLRDGDFFDEVVGIAGRSVRFEQGAVNPIRYWPH